LIRINLGFQFGYLDDKKIGTQSSVAAVSLDGLP
jgi:hypothetical protein